MYVTTEQVQIGVANYVEDEIAKKAVGFNKFMAYFAMPVISDKIAHFMNSFAENEFFKDMFDENNNVDIDAVYNMAKGAMAKSGQFVMFGIVFNSTDVDKLYTHIRNVA